MGITREQINLLKKRRGARSDYIDLYPTRDNLDYLRRFFRNHKKLSLAAVALLFGQGLFEIVLIVISHRYLQGGGQWTATFNQYNLFLTLLPLSLLYLSFYFLAIKSERTLVITLINDLRRKWFTLRLHQSVDENNLENKGALLAKISYHLPLLATGLTNSLVGAVRWLLLVMILIFLSLVFGHRFLWLLLPVVCLSLGVVAVAFQIAKNYVTRETTFYSKIIQLVDFSLSDWNFTKFFGRERSIAKDFNYLVDLDSYFRVRRELWMRFGGGVVFVFLIFFGWFLNFFSRPINDFLALSDVNVRFALLIFVIYFSRLLYESLHIGLYLVPFLLGLALSVPAQNPKKLGRVKFPDFQELVFKSAKTKFFKKDRYHKQISFFFKAGGRYLVTAPHRSGKTFLAKFLTGGGLYGRRAWIIKVEQRRFFYNDFFENYSGFYFIDPFFMSQRTLLEVATGKEKKYLTDADLLRVSERVNSQPELKDIFFEKDDWRLKSHKFLTNAKNILLLQVLYCLEKKPFLIAVDNYWLDYDDSEIEALLNLLRRELTSSIIIFFATKRRDDNVYDSYYEV